MYKFTCIDSILADWLFVPKQEVLQHYSYIIQHSYWYLKVMYRQH